MCTIQLMIILMNKSQRKKKIILPKFTQSKRFN